MSDLEIPTVPFPPRKVLLTGGAGYLGRHMTERLQRDFDLRVLDVMAVPSVAAENMVTGSVADTALVEKAVEGMDAVVIAHMAPNRPEVYGAVELPFDINVKGTAALFDAAARNGIKRVVLVSSVAPVDGEKRKGAFLTEDLRYSPQNMYGLTKTLQEVIARYYHEMKGMEVVVLRPSYIITEDPLEDKYGRKPASVNYQFIDPKDIAEAAALGLTAPEVGFDVIYNIAGPGAEEKTDLGNNRIGWMPKHRFDMYPLD